MTPDLARLMAAQAKADELVAAIAESPDGGPMLRVAVTDVETGQRLATGFVTYQVDGAPLRLVTS
jgi:nicotinamide mononucleotide (NMN) deamidase PncC